MYKLPNVGIGLESEKRIKFIRSLSLFALKSIVFFFFFFKARGLKIQKCKIFSFKKFVYQIKIKLFIYRRELQFKKCFFF